MPNTWLDHLAENIAEIYVDKAVNAMVTEVVDQEGFQRRVKTTLQEALNEKLQNSDVVDTLDNLEKKYTAQDMELIAVHMRRKFLNEIRKSMGLPELREKVGV